MSHAQPSDRPALIVLAGQPGSGKSHFAKQLSEQRHDVWGMVILDIDALHRHHPHKHVFDERDAYSSATCTMEVCRYWHKKLEEYAVQNNYNLLVQTSLGGGESVLPWLSGYKNAGYRVEVHVLSVRSQTSEQRVLERYAIERSDSGVGRMVPASYYRQVYSSLPFTLALIESKKAADRITIYNRKQQVLYTNHLNGNEWYVTPAAKRVVEVERTSLPTVEERANECAQIKRIFALMPSSPSGADLAMHLMLVALRDKTCFSQQNSQINNASTFYR